MDSSEFFERQGNISSAPREAMSARPLTIQDAQCLRPMRPNAKGHSNIRDCLPRQCRQNKAALRHAGTARSGGRCVGAPHDCFERPSNRCRPRKKAQSCHGSCRCSVPSALPGHEHAVDRGEYASLLAEKAKSVASRFSFAGVVYNSVSERGDVGLRGNDDLPDARGNVINAISSNDNEPDNGNWATAVPLEVVSSEPEHYRLRCRFGVARDQTGGLTYVMGPDRTPLSSFPVASERINSLMPSLLRAVDEQGGALLASGLREVHFLTTLAEPHDAVITLVYDRWENYHTANSVALQICN